MRLLTFLVLILATLSSSCFNLAAGNFREPGELEKAILDGLGKEVNKDDTKFQNAISRIKAAHNDHLNHVGPNDSKDELLKNFENKLQQFIETQLKESKDTKTAAAKLNQFIENIEKTSYLEHPNAAPLKEIALKSAEVMSSKPSKWKYFWIALKIIFGGVVAGLILAAIYGMIQ